MVIREYGTENSRHLVFFQGSCEPWQKFLPAAEGLAGAFHVMLVIPDGHDPEDHNDFISVEKTADDTARWLKERGIGHLDALYGLSFGGGMAVRFLAAQEIPVDKAVHPSDRDRQDPGYDARRIRHDAPGGVYKKGAGVSAVIKV